MRDFAVFIAVTLLVTASTDGAAARGATSKQTEEKKSVREPDDQLDERYRRLAKSIVTTYRAGDYERMLGIVRKSLARASIDDVLATDKYLEKSGGTSLSGMVWRSRRRLSQSGSESPPPIAIEALLMAKQIAKSLDKEIDELRKLEIMADPLEDTRDFLKYRDLVWEHHVHSNEVANLKKFATQGVQMSRRIAATRKTKHDRLARVELAKYDFKEYSDRPARLKQELDERVLEVRVHRARYAVEILEDEAAGTTDRFFAAYAIGVEADSLVKAIKENKAFKRPLLREPGLADDLTHALARGEKAGGDLVEKSRLLFAGLHWWRRGRYGMGTEAFGLLKSKAAMGNPRLRTALMMPKSTPTPTDPMSTNKRSTPNYQRRHMYIWGYEDRVFTKSTSSSNSSTTTRYADQKSPLVNKHFDGMIGDKFW